MAADGSVVLDVGMNVSDAEKKLKKLTGDIEKTEQEITDMTKKREAADQKGVLGAAELDAEKAKLQEIKDRLQDIRNMVKDKAIDLETRESLKAQIPGVKEELADQQTRVRALQAEWNKTVSSVERYDQRIAEAKGKLEQQKTAAGALAQEIDVARRNSSGMGQAINQAGAYLDRFTKRVKSLIARAFVFTLISSSLRAMRTWLGNVVKANSEASASMAKLKGALLTLVQPLVNVIIPAFITLVNVLTKVAIVMANIMSKLFGTTIQDSQAAAKSLYEEVNALEDVGDAAKNAGKSMASFDEINQISDQSALTAGDASTEIAPDFTFMDSLSDKLKEKLEEIAEIVMFIGAGFALWKISNLLPGALGDIVSKLGLVMAAIGGIALAFNGIMDAWNNGLDWLNMAEIIGGVAIAAGALYLAFGPIAAGITLIAGGLSMLAVGFHDVMENGWNLQNTLLMIAGILATGLGISLLVGSFIPALIAGIAGILLAITVATGHGEELIAGIQKVLEGFSDFFTGIFSGNIEKAIEGIGKIFDGLKGIVEAVLSGIKDFFLKFLDWLDKKTGGRFHGIIETAKGFVTTFINDVSTALGGFIDGVRQVFEGLITFFTGVFTADFDMAWKGIVDIFKGVWNSIVSLLEGAINLIIDGINSLISKLNNFGIDLPEVFGGGHVGFSIPSVSRVSIPRLAQGAVIPPNREFLAVLGDQKRGTNIEAPAELIQQMVTEGIQAAMRSGSGRDIYITLEMDRRVFAKAVYKANSEESQRVGVSFAGV